jgi:hypothetical protein
MAWTILVAKLSLIAVGIGLSALGLFLLNSGLGEPVPLPSFSGPISIGEGSWPFGAVVTAVGLSIVWLAASWRITVRRKRPLAGVQALGAFQEEEVLFSFGQRRRDEDNRPDA